MGSRETDWDSSFNQILNRTKQNLNRINQRYAPNPELTASYNLPIVPAISNNENRYSRSNVYESSNQNTLNNSQSATKNSNRVPSSADQDSLIYALIERVSKLELSEQANASTAQRLTAIEKTLGDINSSISSSFHDMKEMQRNILSLQNKSAVTSGIIEVIQHDNDSKRSVISKMDSWIRQGEIWREDVDEKMNTLRKLTAQQDRQRQEQRDQVQDSASKYDLEQLRDKVSIQTQQTISAQLSAWYEKVEYNLRNLEKQVALVRINASPNQGLLVTPEEVHAALNISMPSEMLVKGAVSTQILDLEGKLEEKLEQRLSAFLKNEAIKSHNDLQKVIRDKINLLCAENGIVGGSGGTAVNAEDPFGEEGGISDTQLLEEAQVSERYRKRIVNAKLEAEKELFSLSTQISDIRGSVASLQNTINVDQNTSRAALLNMERKVEEAIVISNNSVQNINSRYSKIEDRQRESDVKQSDAVKNTKEELIAKINDLSKDWLLERVTLDRRLLINENIAADCLERIKLSTTVLDSYFQNSKDVISFRQTAEDFGKLQVSFSNLTNEVRDTSNAVFKLTANNVTKSEYVSMMERLTAMEPVVHDTIPEYVESTKKLVDYSLVMQAKVSNIENINAHNNNELQTVTTRLNSVTTTANTASSLATVASEELKLVSGRLNQLDNSYHVDVTSLKDLTGAMSSRIMAVESKLTLASKTAQSENVIKNNQLLSMSTQISGIQSSHNDLQATLSKIQNAAESHRNEVNTKLSLMDIRVHQAQHSSGGAGMYSAPNTASNAGGSYSSTATPNTSFASQSGGYAAPTTYTAPAAAAPVVTSSTTAGYVVEKNKWNNNTTSTTTTAAAPTSAAVNASSSFADSEAVNNSFDEVTSTSFTAVPTAAPKAATSAASRSSHTAASSGAFLTDHSVSVNDRTQTDDQRSQDHDDRNDEEEQGVNDLEDSYMSTTDLEPLPHHHYQEDTSASLVQESYLNTSGDRKGHHDEQEEEEEEEGEEDEEDEEHSIEDPDQYNSASVSEASHHSDHDDDRSQSGSEHDENEEEDEQLSVHDGEPSPPRPLAQSVSLEALAAKAHHTLPAQGQQQQQQQQQQQSLQRQSQLDHSVLDNSFDESTSMLDIPDLDKSTTHPAKNTEAAGQRSSLEDSFASSDLEEVPRHTSHSSAPTSKPVGGAAAASTTSTAADSGVKKTASSDSDYSVSKIDSKANKTIGDISMIPMSNNNSFDDSTLQLDNSLLGHGLSSTNKAAIATTTTAAAGSTGATTSSGGTSGNKNSSLMLNSFDESMVQSTPAKSTPAASTTAPTAAATTTANVAKTSVPPLDFKPPSQKLHNDWDDYSDAELSPHKPTATKPSSSAVGSSRVDESDSSFATCASPSPGSDVFPATTTAPSAASLANANSYVPVAAPSYVTKAETAPAPTATATATAVAPSVKPSAPTPVSVASSSAASSLAPTPTLPETAGLGSTVSAVTATLSIKERLKLRQEMLKQQKLDSASGVSLDRASPVPTVSTVTGASAVPVTVTAAAPAASTAPLGIAASASVVAAAAPPAPVVAPTVTASAPSSTASSGAALSPRKPVIPTLSLPPKSDPATATTATAAAVSDPASALNRRKSIDDVLTAKSTNQLDFSFDSDSEDDSSAGKGGNNTSKYSAPAASSVSNTSKGGSSSTAASKTASKPVYEDDVQEFDADEFD